VLREEGGLMLMKVGFLRGLGAGVGVGGGRWVGSDDWLECEGEHNG
jgi:hypothetical protein